MLKFFGREPVYLSLGAGAYSLVHIDHQAMISEAGLSTFVQHVSVLLIVGSETKTKHNFIIIN